MPVNKHLEFAEISDFTPGYFSVGEWLMPANGSQEMTDCRPDPAGGLRASNKPTSFSTSGIVSTGKVCGMYSRGGIALQAGGSDGSDRYIAVYDPADGKVKVYRWNETTTSPATAWTLIKTHSAGLIPTTVQFDTFIDSTGAAHVVWSLAAATGVNADGDNLWSLQFSYQAGQGSSAIDDLGVTATQSVASHLSDGTFCTALGVQDDRIIVATGARVTALKWSASQSITSFPAPNTLTVQASRQGSVVMSITPFAPGDLLIGTRYSAWTMVQGAITDPIVRTMSEARSLGYGQRGSFTTNGLAFVSEKTGVFITGNGENFQDISQQIDPALWSNTSNNGSVGGGNTAYAGNFLIAPHGLFYDERTQGWHRSSVLTAAADHFHSWADLSYRQIFAATGGAAFSLYVFDTKETARWNTYTWKSAPMRREDNRRIRIREVQLVLKAYDAATVAVTVNGTTVSRTLATGRQTVSFLFDEIAEILDVQVVPTAASSSVEAPSIEAVRVGAQSFQQAY